MKLILLLFTLGCGPSPSLVEIAPGEQVTVCSEGPENGVPVVLVPGPRPPDSPGDTVAVTGSVNVVDGGMTA